MSAFGKLCSKCSSRKPEEEFSLTGRGYRSSTCKPCAVQRAREWRIANPERYAQNRRKAVLAKYGLTPELFDDMKTAQDGDCLVCFLPLGSDIVIDHDHACCPDASSCGDCVRGLLHHKCNVLLGMADDSVELLKGAIRYLEGTSPC